MKKNITNPSGTNKELISKESKPDFSDPENADVIGKEWCIQEKLYKDKVIKNHIGIGVQCTE